MTLKDKIKLHRLLPALVVAVGVFWLGWAVGNGKISYNAPFRKSVSKNLPANLDYSSVEQAYDLLRTKYDGQLDSTKLLDGLKQGLAEASGDPYTEYLNPQQAKEFNSQLNGSFTGIGAELSKDPNGNIIIISPISGFPADKAGLRPKDLIQEIDGQRANNITISDAVSKIRGPKGTKVKLKIIRSGNQELNFEITRDQITIPSVSSKVLEGNIGYLKISTFNQDTAKLAKSAASSFKQANVKGIVLDLRDDPGGLLDAAVDVSSLWLNNKVVLLEKRGSETIRTYRSANNAMLNGIPTVVLINEGSASASEITAGALKDNGAATLLGSKSFGKGSVQQLENLNGGSQLKVTIARWYTPNDKNINKEGIQPDQKVDRTDDDFKNNKDPQLDAAIEFLQK